jgi:transposase
MRNFLRRYRQTGDIAAKPQRGARRSKIKGKDEELLQKLVKEQNDIYLRELQRSLLDRTGLEVSESSLWRQVNRLKLGRPKKFNSQLTALLKSSKAAV